MATTTASRRMTVEELEQTPLEGRYELIDGELVEMSPSGDRASSTAATVTIHLGNHVLPRRLGRIYGADAGFVLFPDRVLVRVPDVSFVRAERLPSEADRDRFARLAPDLAVEVVSPTDRMTDVVAKVMMYQDAGVPLVWVIDPRERWVMVYEGDRPIRLLREGEELDGGNVLPEFRVPVADLFL
jgi:Uma2 family endonuclease